jgi:hypothetical protein
MESDDNLFLNGCDRTTLVQRARVPHSIGDTAATAQVRIFKNTALYAQYSSSGIGFAIR